MGSTIDLSPFIARGFPGNADQDIADTPVAGLDREQTQSMVRLCPETEAVLYGEAPTVEGRPFSPEAIAYHPGARPVLETIVAGFTGDAQARARQAMTWTATHVRHPHHVGPLAPDRRLTEEQLIESGVGWCNEQTRVFIALCEVMEIPARVCFVFHANQVCGHTCAEVRLDNRWAFFDVTFDLVVTRPDGLLAEGRELSGSLRDLAHEAYRPRLEAYLPKVLPFVNQAPGWNPNDRPHPDRGGDLLDVLGITNYVINGCVALPDDARSPA